MLIHTLKFNSQVLFNGLVYKVLLGNLPHLQVPPGRLGLEDGDAHEAVDGGRQEDGGGQEEERRRARHLVGVCGAGAGLKLREKTRGGGGERKDQRSLTLRKPVWIERREPTIME